MTDETLDFFILNNIVHEIDKFEGLYIDNIPSVYEVIRLIDGIPLFLEEHFERLCNSTKLINLTFTISLESIKENILKLVVLNKARNYNIKIVVNSLDKVNLNCYLYFISSSYPTDEMYKNGVETFLYSAERANPNAKLINSVLRNEINFLLKENSCYEAILVNKNDEITEGSRSNLFFIKENSIYTATSKNVLIGITRQRIIKQCLNDNIKVNEKIITTSDLPFFEAAFISGTSPKVLPISSIEKTNYSVKNKLLLKVMENYNAALAKYINNFK